MKFLVILLAPLALCGLVACDPGLIRKPFGWNPNNEGFHTTTYSDLSIGVTSISGLIGQRSVTIRVNVRNDSSESTTIENIAIQTETEQYFAKYANSPVTVKPFSSFISYISFDFERPLSEVFKGHSEIVFSFTRQSDSFLVRTNLVNGI